MSASRPMEPRPWKPIEAFHAQEGTDPLANAFAGRRAVHPFVGLSPVPESEWSRTWTEMTSAARSGKSVAYLHIPFCESHCLFCGFYQNTWHESAGAVYAEALVEHLKRDRDRPYQAEGPIQAVYVGGGTPTLLSTRELARVITAARAHLPLAPDCEITVEGRARDLEPDKAQALFDAGVNRLSIGVQSFDQDVRRRLGRRTERGMLLRRLEDLVAADRGAVIVDLIYGLPGQTPEVWEEDVRTAIGLGLDGLDLYALKLMPQTPLAVAARAGKLEPAAVESHGAFYARGAELMDEARWEPLSSSHWRRSTRERNLYNLEIKAGAQCLAFGAGAGGCLGGHSYRLLADVAEYAEYVRPCRPLLGGLMRLSPHHRLLDGIKGGLERGRLDQWALADRLATTTGLDLEQVAGPLLDQWQGAGLLTRDGRWLELTLAGRFWQVTLTQNLLEWLDQRLRDGAAPVERPAALA